ncbi:MAG TPA: hypothetical protein VFO83_00350 [Aggregicoccus sp.]|nr:hypothetical protein [Aggregicoccus sp.]
MAARAKQAAKGPAKTRGRAKLKKKDLKKTGGRLKLHTDPLLDGGNAPVMGLQRKRSAAAGATARAKALPISATEKTALRRAKAYTTGIARGGVTGGKPEGKRTPSVGLRGRNPGRG